MLRIVFESGEAVLTFSLIKEFIAKSQGCSLKNNNIWGRHGFDGDYETGTACRALLTRKSDRTLIIANDYDYALAA